MTSATAIIDARAPLEAIEKLETMFSVLRFYTRDITYQAVSCHPDVFIFQGQEGLVIAPNTPPHITSFLDARSISYTRGEKPVGCGLDDSTQYNCVETNAHLFHKAGFTDQGVRSRSNKPLVALPQAYTRCSLCAIDQRSFITSDRGIERVLLDHGFSCFYIDPAPILLPPYKHGFAGGCMGTWDSTLYVIGSLDTLDEGPGLKQFVADRGFAVVELYDGRLYDGGGIFFVS